MALQGALRGLAGLVWGIVCVWFLRGLDWLVGPFSGRFIRISVLLLRLCWSGVVSRNAVVYCWLYEMR